MALRTFFSDRVVRGDGTVGETEGKGLVCGSLRRKAIAYQRRMRCLNPYDDVGKACYLPPIGLIYLRMRSSCICLLLLLCDIVH